MFGRFFQKWGPDYNYAWNATLALLTLPMVAEADQFSLLLKSAIELSKSNLRLKGSGEPQGGEIVASHAVGFLVLSDQMQRQGISPMLGTVKGLRWKPVIDLARFIQENGDPADAAAEEVMKNLKRLYGIGASS